MEFSSSYFFKISPIIHTFVFFLVVSSSLISPVFSSSLEPSNENKPSNKTQNTFKPGDELQKLRRVRQHLKKINKTPLKTIQSVDGDLIDCILVHHQPAFDHPLLRGKTPLEEPEMPKGQERIGKSRMMEESFQLWHETGEACPEGTIPVRRTTEEDMMRASTVKSFGRKPPRVVRRDSSSTDHEHAVGYVSGEQYYGAKANINVWSPKVADPYEFSLSQMWVISGSFGDDLNTIEAGWQVSPEIYGDNYPRFFTYWTSDAYQATGCYNLLCSGFVQTNNRIAIGAAISPTSSYNGGQFDISLLIWKVIRLPFISCHPVLCCVFVVNIQLEASFVNSAVEIGDIWPTTGIGVLDHQRNPFLKSLILVSSGATVTCAHQYTTINVIIVPT